MLRIISLLIILIIVLYFFLLEIFLTELMQEQFISKWLIAIIGWIICGLIIFSSFKNNSYFKKMIFILITIILGIIPTFSSPIIIYQDTQNMRMVENLFNSNTQFLSQGEYYWLGISRKKRILRKDGEEIETVILLGYKGIIHEYYPNKKQWIHQD